MREESPVSSPRPAALPPRILGVDDDATFRALLREALALLAAGRFALVLADPPDRGWSALERLRAAGDTPVVVCTGRDPRAFADWAARGFADFLPKPCALAALLATVAAHCPPAPRRS
jgi:CheY-like chemotaxis protein